MKIRPVGIELSYVGERTDKTNLISLYEILQTRLKRKSGDVSGHKLSMGVLLFHMRTVITYYGTKHVEKILGLRFEV
jgi:hypothetical protein